MTKASAELQSFGLLIYYQEKEPQALMRVLSHNFIGGSYDAQTYLGKTFDGLLPHLETHGYVLVDVLGMPSPPYGAVSLYERSYIARTMIGPHQITFTHPPVISSAQNESVAMFFRWLQSMADKARVNDAYNWTRLMLVLGFIAQPTQLPIGAAPTDTSVSTLPPEEAVTSIDATSYRLVFYQRDPGDRSWIVRLVGPSFISAPRFVLDGMLHAQPPITSWRGIICLPLDASRVSWHNNDTIMIFDGEALSQYDAASSVRYSIKLSQNIGFFRASTISATSFITVMTQHAVRDVLNILAATPPAKVASESKTSQTPTSNQIRWTPVRYGEDDAMARAEQPDSVYAECLADVLLRVCIDGRVSLDVLVEVLKLTTTVTVASLTQALQNVDLKTLCKIAQLVKLKPSTLIDMVEQWEAYPLS